MTGGSLVGASVTALSGAFFFAAAATLQQREAGAVVAGGIADPRLLWRLARRPWWILGILADAIAAVLHIWALSLGSVALVQPLGVTGLLFAIPMVAAVRRQRIPVRDLAAALAVLGGLVLLLNVFPATTTSAVPGAAAIAVLVGVTLAVGLGAVVAAHFAGPRIRALLLASAAGVCFGVTAVLARAILELIGESGSAGAVVAASAGVAVLVAGGYLCLQNSYRTGHFAGSLAAAVVVDPVAAILAGLQVLGDPAPKSSGQLVLVMVCAVVIVGGVAVLVRSPAHVLELAAAEASTTAPSAAAAPAERPTGTPGR